MSSLQFLSKKSWHVHTRKNEEKVWLAEQAAQKEAARTAELQKQLEEERKLEEIRRIEREAGHGGPESAPCIDWMYNGTGAPPASTSAADQEDLLLGSRHAVLPGPTAEPSAPAPVEPTRAVAASTWLKGTSLRDAEAKLREDPLLAIRREEAKSVSRLVARYGVDGARDVVAATAAGASVAACTKDEEVRRRRRRAEKAQRKAERARVRAERSARRDEKCREAGSRARIRAGEAAEMEAKQEGERGVEDFRAGSKRRRGNESDGGGEWGRREYLAPGGCGQRTGDGEDASHARTGTGTGRWGSHGEEDCSGTAALERVGYGLSLPAGGTRVAVQSPFKGGLRDETQGSKAIAEGERLVLRTGAAAKKRRKEDLSCREREEMRESMREDAQILEEERVDMLHRLNDEEEQAQGVRDARRASRDGQRRRGFDSVTGASFEQPAFMHQFARDALNTVVRRSRDSSGQR